MINTSRYLCTHHMTKSDIGFVYLFASGDMSQSGMTLQNR